MRTKQLETLKKIKQKLQIRKVQRIDSLRMQVNRCDKVQNEVGVEFAEGIVQQLIKDDSG